MKKLRNGLMSAVLAASLVAPIFMPVGVLAEVEKVGDPDVRTHDEVLPAGADYSGKTVILHTNDVHGAIAGYAYIAELEDEFEAAGAEVISVDCGDYSQGETEVNYYKGADAIDMMNLAGYEYATIGNHEFDFGYDQLKSNLSKAEFKTLCADVLADGKTIFDSSVLHETKDGLKIGFFGMETPETKTKTNPALIQGLEFISNAEGTALSDCGAEQVKQLKEDGADLVICLAHLGVDKETELNHNRSYDLYDAVEGIDMILDGHSHTEMTEGEKGEMIQSTGTKFESIGVVVIDDTKKAIEDHYLVKTVSDEGEELLKKDEATEAAAKKIEDEIDAIYGTVIGKSEVRFASEKTENRCYETNTGDLVTDSMLWFLEEQEYPMLVPSDHVVAITNGGGIRAGLEAGADVTMKDINTILPFGNTITVAYVKGSVILEALEASTFCTPDPIGGFPQTKGIYYMIDTSKEFDAGELYPGSEYHKPNSIRRVKILSINGERFNEDDIYAVVTNNFISDGGDTYYAFTGVDSTMDTGIPLDMGVMAYIQYALGGELTAADYGESRGDLVFEAPEVTDPAPVAITKLKAGKKKLTVNFKPEDPTLAVVIVYSTDKDFSPEKTKVAVAMPGETKTVLKKLKSKKKYYVKVRAEWTDFNHLIPSEWSEVMSKKVK